MAYRSFLFVLVGPLMASEARSGEEGRSVGEIARIPVSLRWAMSQRRLANDLHWLQVWPVGFSSKGKFAVIIGGSAYQGECEASECGDGGGELLIYDLNTDEAVARLRVEELIDAGSHPMPKWAGTPTNAEDVNALLEKHGIVQKSARSLPNVGDDAPFTLSGVEYRLITHAVECPKPKKGKKLSMNVPCRRLCNGGPDASEECEEASYFEVLLRRKGAGSKVITRFHAQPTYGVGASISGVVADTSGKRIAIIFSDSSDHEGQSMVGGFVVGSNLHTRFKKKTQRTR